MERSGLFEDRRFGAAARGTVLILTCGGLLSSCKGIAHEGKQQPVSIFEAFTPTTPAMAAAWAADEYDADKRYRGMLLLANAPFGGERVYVEMYTKASADADPAVRSAAIRGLALHGSPEHVPLILQQFDDPDRLLRWECARALQRLHNREAIPALLKHSAQRTEEEALVRAASADALGQYAEPRVIDGLTAALGDRDLSVNEAA
ncbi:MAG: HEAT repeat domain-containing protein, partial [Phycisphaerae bacterium]|nr:HEAT repeat domain-containing protein [Phycisphaerae bacterium]